MRSGLSLLAIAALVVTAILFAHLRSGVSAQEQAVTINLGPGRDASQTGTAVLTPQGNQTQVLINIQPGPAGADQPAHIHQGLCPGVGPIQFPLTNVREGRSTTMVNATLSSLRTGNFSINVHRGSSQTDLAIFVSCGNIPAAAQATPTPTGVATGTPVSAATSPAIKGGPVAGGPPGGDSFSWSYFAIALGGAAVLGGGFLALRASVVSGASTSQPPASTGLSRNPPYWVYVMLAAGAIFLVKAFLRGKSRN